MQYKFNWHPAKEHNNFRKHRVSFRRASTVFRDPNHLSIFDEIHSVDEDRWITLGIDNTGILQVVVHTFEQVEDDLVEIRIISARHATKNEMKHYTERRQ